MQDHKLVILAIIGQLLLKLCEVTLYMVGILLDTKGME